MSTRDNLIAADQLKCVRALSVILADGTLPAPQNWHIGTYPGYDPPIAPRLEGFFFDSRTTPTVAVLRERIGVYAETFGLALSQRPHGQAGTVAVYATGTWQGVELHIWGPALEADVDAQRAELHLDLADELLADLGVRACYAEVAQ